MYSLVTLSTFTVLCNGHCYLVSGLLSSPPKETLSPFSVTPHCPLPKPWPPLIYFLSLMNWLLPDISYKQNKTCGLRVWLSAPTTMFSRFTCVLAQVRMPLLFTAESYCTGWTGHVLFILSGVNKPSGLFLSWPLPIVLL